MMGDRQVDQAALFSEFCLDGCATSRLPSMKSVDGGPRTISPWAEAGVLLAPELADRP